MIRNRILLSLRMRNIALCRCCAVLHSLRASRGGCAYWRDVLLVFLLAVEVVVGGADLILSSDESLALELFTTLKLLRSSVGADVTRNVGVRDTFSSTIVD